MNLIQSAANDDRANSFANRMRSRRFARFEGLCRGLDRPLRIIDFGGTGSFWEQRGWAGRPDVHITMINIAAEPQVHDNIVPVVGDATDLASIADHAYDVAFSNSVIEHLFTFEQQAAMAREVRRVARAYWVQTPNFWFPMEPHFLVPGWHWMPESVRVAMIRRRKCGWRGPCPDREHALRTVREIRLLTRREMKSLFPDAEIWGERFMGLVKSWTAYAGFAAGSSPSN